LEKTGRKRKKCPVNSPPGVYREGPGERRERVYGDPGSCQGLRRHGGVRGVYGIDNLPGSEAAGA